MAARVVIVGEDNPYGDDPRFALYHVPRGASGDRLRAIMGLRDSTYEAIAKVNLCPARRWSLRTARASVWDIEVMHDVAILLGAKVRHAFGCEAMPFFAVRKGGSTVGPTLVLLPHPSGRNLMWNDPFARARARAVLRMVEPSIPWGDVP